MCVKCGAEYLGDRPPEYSPSGVFDPDESKAEVKFRSAITYGTKNFTPGEEVILSYTIISDILQQAGAVFYFRKPKDKAQFLAVYTEFEGWNI